jgi:transcriptional regulator with XRE-family HTH domain
MIDNRQIRAARALLEWSQADLARAAGMAVSSIKAIESCASTPRRETLEAIAATFEAAGVDFCPPSGVRLKSDVVTVHQGRDAATELMNSILRHAPNDPSQEVCIIGLDEQLAAELDGPDVHPNLRARLGQAGVRERVLIAEGVKEFLRDEASYRWMPRDGFCRNAPIYIYGDKVAVQSGTLRRQTIIIDAKPLAQHLRALFGVLWKESETPWDKPAFAVKRSRSSDDLEQVA